MCGTFSLTNTCMSFEDVVFCFDVVTSWLCFRAGELLIVVGVSNCTRLNVTNKSYMLDKIVFMGK